MFRRIVVPLDGSQTAQRVLDVALGIADANGASMAFCCVVDSVEFANAFPQAGKTNSTWSRQIRNNAIGVLKAAVAAAVDNRIEASMTILEGGRSADAIIAFAKQRGADAIVMSAFGNFGFTRAVLGSIAEDVLAHANCTVVTIRGAVANERTTQSDRPAMAATA